MNVVLLSNTATILCLVVGLMAYSAVIILDPVGVRLWLASFVGLGCLPLGLFIGYQAWCLSLNDESD